jgi:hypothetical protein
MVGTGLGSLSSEDGPGREVSRVNPSVPPTPERPRLTSEPMLFSAQEPIGRTAAGRLERLIRLETRQADYPRIVEPAWSKFGGPIPGLIVAQHDERGAAFGLAGEIDELDRAFRRAAALIELVQAREHIRTWPTPVRPGRGGLLLLDAEYGSLDVLWTFYGTLVTMAQSEPVSLMSLATLAWDVGRYGRKAATWAVRLLQRVTVTQRPSAADQVDYPGEPWGIELTKRIVPVLTGAVEEGYGVDLSLSEAKQEIRLILMPRSGGGLAESPED